MSDQWFYRMFGEDFGPVSFDKLCEMAEKGTVAADDEVRSERSLNWVTAGSVDGLGLSMSGGGTVVAMATISDMEAEVATTRVGLDDWYCRVQGREMGPLSFEGLVKFAQHDNLTANDDVKLGANGKWRRVGSIGRLVAVLPYRAVERETPAPNTKPKPATQTKTPAAEQTVFTSQDNSTPPASATADSTVQVDLQAAYQAAYEQAKAQIAESMMTQAEAAFKSAEESAKTELAWAFEPNMDPQWWGWMGGVEFGPVGFLQVFALAKNGQLKPSDFIRNGPSGQYFPASNAPGLFHAIAAVAKAAEALKLAKVQAQAAAALATPPTMVPLPVVAKPVAVVATPPTNGPARVTTPDRDSGRNPSASASKRLSAESMDVMTSRIESPQRLVATELEPPNFEVEPVVAPVETRPTPASSLMSDRSSAISSSNSYSTTRPAAALNRPAHRPAPSRSSSSSSSSLFDSLESLKDPKALGAVGALAVLLLFVGWQYLPKNSAADVKHFHELKQVFDEVKAKRSSNSNDYSAVLKQADQVSKTITAALKTKASRDTPVKQSLLWAARDELPRVVTALQVAPATPSRAEENFVARLRDAANHLGLKDAGLPAPPPANAIATNAPRNGFPDD